MKSMSASTSPSASEGINRKWQAINICKHNEIQKKLDKLLNSK